MTKTNGPQQFCVHTYWSNFVVTAESHQLFHVIDNFSYLSIGNSTYKILHENTRRQTCHISNQDKLSSQMYLEEPDISLGKPQVIHQ